MTPDYVRHPGGVTRVAARDDSLRAVITARRPLLYAGGADDALDRPAHVRAASSLTMVGDTLVIVQDDANFLGSLRTVDHTVGSVTLPAGHGGRRQFDDVRGNKRFKLDLESSIAVVDAGATTVYAFGSGSSAAREHVVIARGWEAGVVSIAMIEAPALYRALRTMPDFAGSELNVEGAALHGDELWLFGRGNGAVRGDLLPLNATCVFTWPAVQGYLDAEDRAALLPQASRVTRYDLGVLDAIPLGFTDAAATPRGFLYSAAAEDSPDAVSDGPVAGSCLGVIELDGDVRWARLTTNDGAAFTGKVEGITWRADAPDEVIAVIDHDDPRVPSELCTVVLAGDWLR